MCQTHLYAPVHILICYVNSVLVFPSFNALLFANLESFVESRDILVTCSIQSKCTYDSGTWTH